MNDFVEITLYEIKVYSTYYYKQNQYIKQEKKEEIEIIKTVEG